MVICNFVIQNKIIIQWIKKKTSISRQKINIYNIHIQPIHPSWIEWIMFSSSQLYQRCISTQSECISTRLSKGPKFSLPIQPNLKKEIILNGPALHLNSTNHAFWPNNLCISSQPTFHLKPANKLPRLNLPSTSTQPIIHLYQSVNFNSMDNQSQLDQLSHSDSA